MKQIVIPFFCRQLEVVGHNTDALHSSIRAIEVGESLDGLVGVIPGIVR
jgi:hypothetical protein